MELGFSKLRNKKTDSAVLSECISLLMGSVRVPLIEVLWVSPPLSDGAIFALQSARRLHADYACSLRVQFSHFGVQFACTPTKTLSSIIPDIVVMSAKKPYKLYSWCGGSDSNRHALTASGPKPGASTNFATPARGKPNCTDFCPSGVGRPGKTQLGWSSSEDVSPRKSA